jgi:hypothetical protein
MYTNICATPPVGRISEYQDIRKEHGGFEFFPLIL